MVAFWSFYAGIVKLLSADVLDDITVVFCWSITVETFTNGVSGSDIEVVKFCVRFA